MIPSRPGVRAEMDARRIFLYLALGLILILIWTNWHSEHASRKPAKSAPPAATQRVATHAQATAQSKGSPATASQTSTATVSNAAPGAARQHPGQTQPRALSAPA